MIDAAEKERRAVQEAEREIVERILDEACEALTLDELRDVMAHAIRFRSFRRLVAS